LRETVYAVEEALQCRYERLKSSSATDQRSHCPAQIGQTVAALRRIHKAPKQAQNPGLNEAFPPPQMVQAAGYVKSESQI
jgi:hypothetical protein